MTKAKTFKRHVRERMSKTGESYTAARKQSAEKRDRNQSARKQLAVVEDLPSDEAMEKATGKTWNAWFSLLDKWGAKDKKHGEIVRFLGEEHGVDGWWCQSVTVGYERARGLRVKYQGANGFAISSTKTISAPVAASFKAVVDDANRKKWLTDGTMSLRTSQRGKSARFDWNDGSTRVSVGFIDKGPKSTVAIQHEKLADADEALVQKEAWKTRLAALKAYLET